jgi:UDP-3-O-[3-hydroxymyristoyl] glucosamine N-acyltransferase
MTSTRQLQEDFRHIIVATHGNEAVFDYTRSFERADASSLIFIQASEQLDPIAPAVITTEAVAADIMGEYKGFIACVKDVRLAQALIKQAYDDYENRDPEWPDIHPSAVIHESAVLGANVRIGPNVVIGKDVVIGDSVIVRSNSVIEFGVTIGNNSIVNPNVMVGHGCVIGQRVILQSGTVIGNEGYGFTPTPDKRYERIPHTGNVIIGDDVFIGSQCAIDRGTYGSTLIKRGVKVDNLCHIAHNVEIGEDCLIIGQTGLAGSCKIGDRAILSGQSGVLDHKKVAADTILVHRGGVIEDIPSGGMWGGIPAKPMREHTRRFKLDDYVLKRFAKLEEKIAELSDELAKKNSK